MNFSRYFHLCRWQDAPIVAALLVMSSLSSSAIAANERVDGMLMQRGAFGRMSMPDEFVQFNEKEFKGAKKLAIAVFNVAFPSDNEFTASASASAGLSLFSSSSQTTFSSKMTGVDTATQQRIADKAYSLFVAQLQTAGYEVVDVAELTAMAPEYATWDALPNFASGRYGTYVAPTGRRMFAMPRDTDKRDTSGRLTLALTVLRASAEKTQAVLRSPYVANAANMGVLAVTLVVDYGVYSTSGNTTKFSSKSSVGFKPGVTIGAGNHIDSGSYIAYWGPNSGGFSASAYLQRPVFVERNFATIDGTQDSDGNGGNLVVSLTADPKVFEDAATEALTAAIPKFVGVMDADS
ncbi:hypothetical protein GALL_524530 [mine drainage metagenome]|uniref:Uncharacterized protein n=1 Tax=mine drainage metagenome TaxID=410659 RepID=A0A1J5P5H8_9ZZZZ